MSDHSDDATNPPPAPSSVDALVTSVEPPPIASRVRFVVLTSLVAAGVVAIGGSVLWSARAGIRSAVTRGAAHTAAAVPPPVTATPPAPPPAVAPPGAPPAQPPPGAAPRAASPAPSIDVPAGMGRVKTEGSTSGRRIFVDRRTVGQTPETVVVECGVRRIRIGSAGKTMSVDVPCGGEIEVRDR